ncbi:MAG TPA: hypothetical protein VFM54_19620 [Micromonosporaceae bacterium]|nr:hypothetical protein [Micromonosporaceae bacterium]
MDITTHAGLLPHGTPEASLAFRRDRARDLATAGAGVATVTGPDGNVLGLLQGR